MWLNILVFTPCLKEIKDSQKKEAFYLTLPCENVTNNPVSVTQAQCNDFNTPLPINESELQIGREILMIKVEEQNEPISEQKFVSSISEQKSLNLALDVENPTAKKILGQTDSNFQK